MIYTIKKGSNYATGTFIPKFHSGISSLKGTIKFTNSCIYTLTNPNCINDTNKAIGFGYGTYPYAHQDWSIRLGWRCNPNKKLILIHYAYVNGKRIETQIGLRNTFNFDISYPFEIINDTINKKAIVKVGIEEVSIPFDKAPIGGYYLFPYFGGDCSATQNINIEINLL